MTDLSPQAQAILYSYMDVEKDLSQPKILIHTFKELINQLQYNQTCWDEPLQHMVLDVDDILEVCEELKKL